MAKKKEVKRAKIIYLIGVILVVIINLGFVGYQKKVKREYLKNLDSIYLESQKEFSVDSIESKLIDPLASEAYFKELAQKESNYYQWVEATPSPKKHQSVKEMMLSYYQRLGSVSKRHEKTSLYLNKMKEVNIALAKISASPNDPKAYLLSQQSQLKSQLFLVKEIKPPKIFEEYHNDISVAIFSLDQSLGDLIQAVTARNPQLIAKYFNELNSISLPESGPSYEELQEFIFPKKEKDQLRLLEELISKRLEDK